MTYDDLCKVSENYSFYNNEITFCSMIFWGSVICNPNYNFYVEQDLSELEKTRFFVGDLCAMQIVNQSRLLGGFASII